MHRGIRFVAVLPILALFIACSDASHTPQPVIGPGVQHNMGIMAAMMKDLHLLMFEGPFTERQSTEVSEMMLRVSVLMKEMSGPERERLTAQHEQELKEMRRRLAIIREQIRSQR